MAKFKADDEVTVTDKDHPRTGETVQVQSVPTVTQGSMQRYDLITKDQKHQFGVEEKQIKLA